MMTDTDTKAAAQMCALLRASMDLLEDNLEHDPVTRIALKRALAHAMVLALEWRSGANTQFDRD